MGGILIHGLVGALLFAWSPSAHAVDSGIDTGIFAADVDEDSDRDGFTRAEGDCDDNDARRNPSVVEICSDRIDNDCDGLVDEGCDYTVRQATIRGGGGCTGGSSPGGANYLLPLPLLLLLRRRR